MLMTRCFKTLGGRRFVACFSAVLMFGLMVAMLVSPVSTAQEVGASLFGSVADPVGASVPDAAVTAVETNTGRTFTYKTQTDGGYSISALPPGTYTLTVEHAGFKKAVHSGITLVVFQKARIDVRLALGEVASTVEVTGAAPLVDAGTASIGGIVNQQQVTELPLNIRRFGNLPLLFPGTVSDRGGWSNNSLGSAFSENTYSSNGARGSGNNVLIDGVDSKALYNGGFSVQPSPDSVQEFKVQTESFSAVFGKNAGSTINLVTKSGTNQLHGSVFEFLRNDKLDARNFFSLDRPPYKRNQYGGGMGGPIVKNKTFWFASFDGLRERKGLTFSGLVPTPEMLNGDFSALSTPIIDPLSCENPPSGTGCQAFAGNIISPDRIDSVAKNLRSYFPAPNTAGDYNFVYNPKRSRNDYQVQGRVDQTFGTSDNVFVRYLIGNSDTTDPTAGYTSLPGFGDKIHFRGQNVAASWTHTFSPSVLNELRLGFSRNMDIHQCEACPRKPGFIESLGIANLKGLSPADEGFPYFSLTQGYASIGDAGYRPVESNDMVEKLNDTLTITKGKHTLSVGVDIQPYQNLQTQAPFNTHGQFEFGNLYSNNSVSDFLLGYPSTAGRTMIKAVTNHAGAFWNAFVQDDWRVTKTLTLNMGLRYEYHQLPIDRGNVGAVLVPLPGKPLFQPGNAMLVVPGYQTADAFCNQPQFVVNQGQSNEYHLVACSDQMKQLGFTGRSERSLWFPDRFNYAPRFGFAWRPTSSDKLVVRGGYGLFFDLAEFNYFYYGNNNPIQSPSQYNTFEANVTPPATTQTAFGSGGAVALKDAFLSINVDPHYRQPYVHEWTFNIQSQITSTMSVEARYVGNSGINLTYFHFFGNQAFPGPGDIQPRRPYPDFGFSAYGSSGSNSNYNSLQLQLTRRMANGLSLLAGYTWAKTLVDNDGEEGGYTDGGVGQNDNFRRGEYGRGVNDARQRFVFSGIYQLPFGKGRRWLNQGRILNGALGGWELTSIITFQSGFPLTPLAGTDVANTGTGQWRPDRICNGALPTGQRTVDHWFDTSCFTNTPLEALIAAGTPRFGNSGRSIIDGPGLQNWDLGLIKHFPLREGLKLEFRAEAFNAFNHPYFNDPDRNVVDSNFGQISGASEPRDVQFALKLVW
jgi:hypothetical protein